MNITLRRASEDDCDFAFEVKKAVFKKYVDMVWGWNEAEQRTIHARIFTEHVFWIITRSGKDVGILALVRGKNRIDIRQLFILPEFQRLGIGKHCMNLIMAELKQSALPVYTQTLKVNSPAIAFVEQLGFHRLGETENHIQFEWSSR